MKSLDFFRQKLVSNLCSFQVFRSELGTFQLLLLSFWITEQPPDISALIRALLAER